MKTENQVWRVIVDSNPVPDVNVYGREQLGGTAYLATLEQRSSEMTRVDTKAETPKKKGSRRLIVALATSVAAILAVTIVLLQDDSQPVADDPGPAVGPEEEALLAERTALLTSYADASNSGNVATVMSLFTTSFPPEMDRHPFSAIDFWDYSDVKKGVELMVAAQGSGPGIEFFDIEVGDPDSVVAPDITFNWRFEYGADGSESGGEAGCIGGRDAKIILRAGEISTFNWGFDDATQCNR